MPFWGAEKQVFLLEAKKRKQKNTHAKQIRRV